MILSDIRNELQLLAKTSAPPLIEIADGALESPRWTLGQRLPAFVLASLPNGRFEVRVGDQVLDLNLPNNTQPGEALELTYVSSSPRLTFTLVRDAGRVPPTNPAVALSSAAKFVETLPRDASVADLQIAGAAAAVEVLPTDTREFAQALRASLTQSGLFYESHQLQWLGGERSLASLRQEPQGKLSPGLPPLATAEERPASSILTGPAADVGAQAIAPDGPAADGVHPQAVPLVQQQLQALDTHQIVWQGQVWPDQQMRWEIEQEPQGHGSERHEETAGWQTRLSLQLPVLGGVNARLAFTHGKVRLELVTDAAASADRMHQHQGALAEGFAASGLQLTGLTIRHG